MKGFEKNRSISRRAFLRMSAVGATGVLAAACAPAATQAPAGEKPAGQPAATQAADAAAGPTPEPTAIVAEYGKTDKPAILWSGLTGADGATFQAMLQMYGEQNPDSGVRAETYVWDTLFQKLPTAIAAGTPPDGNLVHDTEMQQFSKQGLFMELDNVVYAPGVIPADDFNPGVMEGVSYLGKKMAIPFDMNGWVAYYNTKVIKDAGLDPEKIPTNGTEFIEFALKVTVDENGKHPDESGFDADKTSVWALHYSWPRFTFPSSARQFGGDIISRDSKKSLLDSPETEASVQYWHDLMYKYKVVPAALPGVPGAYDFMKTGSLAIMWDGSWSLNFFKDNPDVMAVTVPSGLNSLSPDGKRACKISSHTLCIPVNVKEDGVERITHLYKWLSDNNAYWANSGQIPARTSTQADKLVQDGWSQKAAAEAFNEIGILDVPHPAFTEIQMTWEATISGVMANTTPVKEGLAEGSRLIQAVLDRP